MSNGRRLEAHRRAEQFAAAIYGTVVAAGVLAVSASDEDTDVTEVTIYTIATVLVLWIAHAWAHTLGDRAVSDATPPRSFWEILGHDSPLALSAVLPVLGLVVPSLFGATDENAIDIALWTCAFVLGAAGAGIARREGASTWRVIGSAAGCAALGSVMVLLKTIVH